MRKINFSIFKNYPIPSIDNDRKFQALLIYVESLLSDTISEIEKESKSKKNEIFSPKIKKEIINFDKNLITSIGNCCPTLSLIEDERERIFKKQNITNIDMLILKESEPFKNAFNLIANTCEDEIGKTNKWIPDLLSISLIANWIQEYSKTTITYKEFFQLDYQNILDKYNEAYLIKSKSANPDDLKIAQTIKKMYSVSDKVIEELNRANYKTFIQVKNNTSKRKKKRTSKTNNKRKK